MLDQFDIRILEVLQENGDIGPLDMSQRIHLSPSQCSRRMHALRKDGYITAFRAVIDPTRIALGLQAYILITMKSHAPDAANAFRERVNGMDEVLECQKLTGATDMILKVATHNLASFNRLLSALLSAPEVANAQSSIILEDIKSTTRLPLAFARSADLKNSAR